MESKGSKNSDSRFYDWLAASVARNPNLRPLASEIGGFSDDDFAMWIEKALIRIVLEEKAEEDAFSPGRLIIGTSPTGWRDDLCAVIALLDESAKACVVRGIIECFKAVSPRPDDNNISVDGGRNWERYVVELMRLVRDLRPPLCNREATPLKALHSLLTNQFPNSQAILDEGLLLWRAYAHQIEDDEEWWIVFDQHSCFRDEYTPLVAFAHAVRFPSKAFYYLSKWKPYRQYRRKLLHEAVVDSLAKSLLQGIYDATENVVRFVVDRGIRIGIAEIKVDPTYQFFSPIHLPSDRHSRRQSSILLADKMTYVRPPQRIADIAAKASMSSRDDFEMMFPDNSSAFAGMGAR